jgi:hypothetical protein
MTQVMTATETDTKTDSVTMTEISTVVQPTTYTSIWVSTDIIDKVRLCDSDFGFVFYSLDLLDPDQAPDPDRNSRRHDDSTSNEDLLVNGDCHCH